MGGCGRRRKQVGRDILQLSQSGCVIDPRRGDGPDAPWRCGKGWSSRWRGRRDELVGESEIRLIILKLLRHGDVVLVRRRRCRRPLSSRRGSTELSQRHILLLIRHQRLNHHGRRRRPSIVHRRRRRRRPPQRSAATRTCLSEYQITRSTRDRNRIGGRGAG